MNSRECAVFLQWALPQLRLRWPGFRRVRSQVCKRVQKRMRLLGIESVEDYRQRLQACREEWAVLDGLCHISISRFYRDRGVFEYLQAAVLTDLAEQTERRGAQVLRAWSAGCASGEEPYSLTIMWHLALHADYPDLALEVVATDVDCTLLDRARRALYTFSSTKDLPAEWRNAAFSPGDGELTLKALYRAGVTLRQQDIRATMPEGPFDLILCRNLAFTYFADDLQIEVARGLAERLAPGGALVIGSHEQLPQPIRLFEPWSAPHGVYRRRL